MRQDIKPVTFRNKNGHNLFGMLHIPEKPKKNVGIIILSPGIKSRVAPHRLYVKMADRFCQMGFQVLRFDPEGLGDSEGEIDEKFAADVYGSIQVGRFIDDTISAMDWMENEYDVSRFILSGLCGGAITGLLTGAKDKRVDSLLSLGIPVILDSTSVDQSQYITQGQLGSLRDGYVKKSLDPESWVRLLTLKSDYRLMFKSLMQPLVRRFRNTDRKSNTDRASAKESCEAVDSNFNPYFPQAFAQMASNRKLLLIFSGSDRLYWEFEEKFANPYSQLLEKHRSGFEIHIAKKANHIFSFKEWQEEMLDKSCEWLRTNFLYKGGRNLNSHRYS